MPKGIDVIYNGVRYNKWTSQTFGDVSPNSLNTPVYLGVNGTGTLPTSGNSQLQMTMIYNITLTHRS